MSNDMIAITASKLPAHLQGKAKTNNLFAAAMSVGGFPVVSLKGKEFTVIRGDEKNLITNADGDAAGSIEAVIIAANPNKSKVYYAETFTEGSTLKPTCYSNNGSTPSEYASEPQAKKCAVCPHNEWGSKITDNGGKGKACGDSMRLCIAATSQLNDPMLLRVPAATLKALGQYGQQLAKRGLDPHMVVTKIGFERGVAYPSLTFKATRFVEQDELEEIEAVLNDEAETVGQITGLVENAPSNDSSEPAAPAKSDDDAPKAEAPKKKEKKAVVEEEAVAEEAENIDDIDAALDDLDFDD
jgi:hypothetical protein